MQLRWRRIALGLACTALLVAAWQGAPRQEQSHAARRAQPAAPAQASGAPPPRDAHRLDPGAAAPASTLQAMGEPPPDPRVQRCEEDFQAAAKARIAELARSDSARDQAAAALFDFMPGGAPIPDPTHQSKRLTALAKANPDDRVLAWAAAVRCGHGQPCERAAVERVLRVDGDNMAAWLFAMDRALGRNDEAEADALLHRAARAPRLQLFWREPGLLAIDALSGLQVPSCEAAREDMGRALGLDGPMGTDDLATVFALATAAAVPMPLGATRMCPRRGSVPAARVPACRAVFARMAEGDELISRALGISRMRAWARTPAERAAWKERQRDFLWLQQEAHELRRASRIRMMLEHGEAPFLQALLEEQGRWPAPAGWLPENEHLREELERTP